MFEAISRHRGHAETSEFLPKKLKLNLSCGCGCGVAVLWGEFDPLIESTG